MVDFASYKSRVVDMVKKSEMGQLTPQEFCSLFWLNLKVKARNTLEFLKDVCRYYGNWNFAKADLSLHLMYLFHNPYRMSKRFLEKRQVKELDTYGETPLTSFERIVNAAAITEHDCVFELGCGRGQLCFWLQALIGCKVVGIEHNPEFISRAQRLVNRLNIPRLTFIAQDMREADLTGASVCYLCGTCMDEATIRKMIAKFSRLSKGTRVITVSFPLTDYPNSEHLEIMHTFSVPFLWGEADVYIHVVK